MNSVAENCLAARAVESGGARLPPSSEPLEPTPIDLERREVALKILSELEPALAAPVGLSELDEGINALLFNDKFFDLCTQFYRLVGPHDLFASAAPKFPNLERVIGDASARRIEFLLTENRRALRALLAQVLKRPPNDSECRMGRALTHPSYYLGDLGLPPEVKRAWLGSDIAQITLMGLLSASQLRLSNARPLELFEKFDLNLPLWLELLASGGIDVAPEALPGHRVDFHGAMQRHREAATGLNKAVEHLDTTGDSVYFFGGDRNGSSPAKD